MKFFAKRPSTSLMRGFTLVELLVVIAIIGILIGMLLPAVQMVREAARRTSCSNKIRQLALAVHNHESALQRFPVNQIGPGISLGSGVFGPGYYSWLVPLLPHIEQQNLYNLFDLSKNNGDGNSYKVSSAHRNAAAVSAPVDTFLCPSESPTSPNPLLLGTAIPAPSSYAANAGWPSYATGFTGERATPGDFNGAMPLERPASPVAWHPNARFGLKDILDGTSNTALIAERLIQTANSSAQVTNGDPRLRSRHILERYQPLAAIDASLSSSHTHVLESYHIGRSWSSGCPLVGPTYLHVKTPNTLMGHFNTSITEGDFVITPSSRHAGGVNLALVDGSIHFVTDTVSREVWWAIGGRDDGRTESLAN